MGYKIRNWSKYNAGLKKRGSLRFWLEEKVVEQWLQNQLRGKRGASQTDSDIAIATFETMKLVYGLAGRQTEGLLSSIFSLMGIDLPVPEHSTVSRRKGKLEVVLPVVPKQGKVHVVVDSTGVKVYGEGEWKTRQHGVSKRRTWWKLHLGVDESTGEILSAVVTTNDFHYREILEDILDGIEQDIEQVSADGAYDQSHCYESIQQRSARAIIPPRKNAKIWQHGNCHALAHPRDENLRAIRKKGRKSWKQQSNYHRRSLSETTMFRQRCIFGSKVSSRKFDNQATELLIQCSALNRMIQLAKPNSVWVAD